MTFGRLLPWRAAVGSEWASGRHVKGETERWCGVAYLLVSLGWGQRLWAKLTLASLFTYRIAPPDRLITSGPYAVWVHPSYSGAILHVTGLLMLLLVTFQRRRLALGCLVSLALAIIAVRVREEEAMLQEHFGEAAWQQHIWGKCRLPVCFAWRHAL